MIGGFAALLLFPVLIILFALWAYFTDTTVPSSSTAQPPGPPTQFTNRAGLEFVLIKPGSFTMGSPATDLERDEDEAPQHSVNLGYVFYLGKYEVTRSQWLAVTGQDPGDQANCPRCPAAQVTWQEAKSFVALLNAQQDGYQYRLPSEAEWEYACRAGTTSAYYGPVEEIAWYGNNSGSTAHPVGGKQPNAWGLYDLAGNVWEWVEDTHSGDYASAPQDGSARTTGDSSRVLRGGAFDGPARTVRCADRGANSETAKFLSNGLRVVAIPNAAR